MSISSHTPLSFEEIELQLPELRIAAKRWLFRPGEQPPLRILALHGWLDNANSFDALVHALAQCGPQARAFELVALDLPGHGLSEHRSQGPYHFLDAVADAIAAADTLQWDQFTLIGHSMGGGIATLMAAALPDRVENLILLDALGPLVEQPEKALERFSRSLLLEQKNKKIRTRYYASLDEAADRIEFITGMNKSSAEILAARALKTDVNGYCWRADRRLRIAARFRLCEAQVQSFLQAILCPVLLVTSDRGFGSKKLMLEQRIPHVSNLHWIQQQGSHHFHLDYPQELAQSLQHFLCAAKEADS